MAARRGNYYTAPPEKTKDELREEINKEVEEFLKKGGVIQEVPIVINGYVNPNGHQKVRTWSKSPT